MRTRVVPLPQMPRRKFRLRLVPVENFYYMWHYPRLPCSTFLPKALLQRHVIANAPRFSTLLQVGADILALVCTFFSCLTDNVTHSNLSPYLYRLIDAGCLAHN